MRSSSTILPAKPQPSTVPVTKPDGHIAGVEMLPLGLSDEDAIARARMLSSKSDEAVRDPGPAPRRPSLGAMP
jgi:hypothetical protein